MSTTTAQMQAYNPVNGNSHINAHKLVKITVAPTNNNNSVNTQTMVARRQYRGNNGNSMSTNYDTDIMFQYKLEAPHNNQNQNQYHSKKNNHSSEYPMFDAIKPTIEVVMPAGPQPINNRVDSKQIELDTDTDTDSKAGEEEEEEEPSVRFAPVSVFNGAEDSSGADDEDEDEFDDELEDEAEAEDESYGGRLPSAMQTTMTSADLELYRCFDDLEVGFYEQDNDDDDDLAEDAMQGNATFVRHHGLFMRNTDEYQVLERYVNCDMHCSSLLKIEEDFFNLRNGVYDHHGSSSSSGDSSVSSENEEEEDDDENEKANEDREETDETKGNDADDHDVQDDEQDEKDGRGDGGDSGRCEESASISGGSSTRTRSHEYAGISHRHSHAQSPRSEYHYAGTARNTISGLLSPGDTHNNEEDGRSCSSAATLDLLEHSLMSPLHSQQSIHSQHTHHHTRIVVNELDTACVSIPTTQSQSQSPSPSSSQFPYHTHSNSNTNNSNHSRRSKYLTSTQSPANHNSNRIDARNSNNNSSRSKSSHGSHSSSKLMMLGNNGNDMLADYSAFASAHSSSNSHRSGAAGSIHGNNGNAAGVSPYAQFMGSNGNNGSNSAAAAAASVFSPFNGNASIAQQRHSLRRNPLLTSTRAVKFSRHKPDATQLLTRMNTSIHSSTLNGNEINTSAAMQNLYANMHHGNNNNNNTNNNNYQMIYNQRNSNNNNNNNALSNMSNLSNNMGMLNDNTMHSRKNHHNHNHSHNNNNNNNNGHNINNNNNGNTSGGAAATNTEFDVSEYLMNGTMYCLTLPEIISDCLQDITERSARGITNDNTKTPSLYYEIASHKFGSQFIQEQIDRCSSCMSPSAFQQLMNELQFIIKDDSIKLSKNGYSNYVIQKYLQFGGIEKKINFINHLVMCNNMNANIIGNLAIDKSGCRVLQKLIDNQTIFKMEMETQYQSVKNVPTSTIVNSVEALYSMSVEDKILLGLKWNFIQCATNANGIHVIQKLIDQICGVNKFSKLKFMIESFKGNVFHLSCNKYACRVMQKLWQRCPNYMCIDLFEEILCSEGLIYKLATNEYGNYVLQNLLINCQIKAIVNKLIQYITPKFETFSKHKFSSNVTETAFELSNYQQKERILNILLVQSGGKGMLRMIEDQYGNYVAQKIIHILSISYEYVTNNNNCYYNNNNNSAGAKNGNNNESTKNGGSLNHMNNNGEKNKNKSNLSVINNSSMSRTLKDKNNTAMTNMALFNKYKKYFKKLVPSLKTSHKCEKFGRNVLLRLQCS